MFFSKRDAYPRWKTAIVLLGTACCLLGQLLSRSRGEDAASPQQDQIQELVQQIGALQRARDLAALEQLVTEAKTKWLPTKNAEYYPVVLELCLALNTVGSTKPGVYDSLRDLVLSVIDSPDEKSAQITGKLLLLLEGDPEYSRGTLRGDAWLNERRIRTERWLRVWKAIADQLAHMPEPSGPLFMNVSPPPETGLPTGVGPEAVKDPVLRKRFEDAIAENKRNAEAYDNKRFAADFEKLFVKRAKRELIGAYSKPPFDTEDLQKALAAANLDEGVQTEIVDEVKKRQAVRIARDEKMSNKPATMQTIEIPPPGTAVYHSDPRFKTKMDFNIPSPKVEQILDQLREATGAPLARADDIQNDYPATGSVFYMGTPAWQVMDNLAAYKYVEGRWEADGDGYRLVRNGNAVAPPSFNPFAPVQPSPGWQRGVRIVGIVLTTAIIFVLLFLLIRRKRLAPS